MTIDRIKEVVRRYWGFDTLRPLQESAIRAGLTQRDSLVVLPTGGGKSLCYQVPPLLAERTDVVVSPLISLMKDQVDALRTCGYPAAAVHSAMSVVEQRQTEREVNGGKCRLIFVAPERLLTPTFLRMLAQQHVRAFAIDEAHCISHWGHDFRPEYRRLATLKERFPQASLHAFTATATERVRADIVQQLGLIEPTVLVGNFDRPNLVYRIVPRVDDESQSLEVLKRHPGEAVIIYCISRKDTEALAEYLRSKKVRAKAYHAGMEKDERRATQDAFAAEKIDVVVATVAFGMGIDRSNVRCVIHTAMPKSIEHYQQETGRAGRDGLEAECVLLYSAQDALRWERLIRKSAEGADRFDDIVAAATELLQHMRRFCNRPTCRHASLVEYFGQSYDKDRCAACDVCLGEVDGVFEATLEAQKILSCVARVKERFGAKQVIDVLRGANTEMIRNFKHEQLSTYGLLRGTSAGAIRDLVYQLIDQELLVSSGGDRPILRLNDESWSVMRGRRPVHLVRAKAPVEIAPIQGDPWEGVDRGLFEDLRALRAEVAGERGVPAFVVFADTTLRDLARWRPSTVDGLRGIQGIGERKLQDLGTRFVAAMASYCARHDLAHDIPQPPQRPRRNREQQGRSPGGNASTSARAKANEMFAAGASIPDVMTAVARSKNTTVQYLVEYITAAAPTRIDEWVRPDVYTKVEQALRAVGGERLAPAHEHLQGEVDYDSIRFVRAHLRARAGG